MVEDPRESLRERPMRPVQVLAAGLCVLAVAIDGFDILAASFTAPAIAHDWRLTPDRLGLLLSAGLIGMVLGALFLAPFADLWGRRRIIVGCLTLATLGMAGGAFAPDYWTLVVLRVVTGAGVAATLAAANTAVAEYASSKRRDLAVIFQAAGFPLGGLIGGLGVVLAPGVGWRTVFGAGAVVSAVVIGVLFALMPESLDYLIARRPGRALERVNALLAKFDMAPLTALPEPTRPSAQQRRGLPQGMLVNTALISAAFFLLMVSFYFLTSWTPKLLTDFGLSRQVGVSGSVFMNLGGIAGDGVFALLMIRFSARKVGPPFLAGAFVAAVALAVVPLKIGALMPDAFLLGALLFGAMASLYAISPTLFAANVRTTGTGLALGLGRIGAALGPWVGGLLIAAHWSRLAYLAAMSAPLLACALVALVLSEKAKHGLPGSGSE